MSLHPNSLCVHYHLSIPNYNIKSRVVKNPIADKIRRVIVEELYGRLRVIFPDESHLLVDTER